MWGVWGWGLPLFLSLFSDSVDFSYYEGSFLLFSSGIFHAASTVPFFFGSVLSSRATLSSENACS